MDSLAFSLTPHGHLILTPDAEAPALEAALEKRLRSSFERGSGHGLLHLGAEEVETALPPVFAYWREFATSYLTALCGLPDSKTPQVAARPDEEFHRIALAAPPMTGGEYLTSAVLSALWQELNRALGVELAAAKCGVQEFLKRCHKAWNLVGRVHFNLAENSRDPDAPFAFLATYTTQLSAQAKAQHLPLGKALGEYAGAANKDRLLSLLLPVQIAAQSCAWLKTMVDAGEIFHPLRWTPQDALQLLKDVPALEAAGVVVRMPAAWRGNQPARPRVTGTVGRKEPSQLGQDALLDFRMEVTLDGEALTADEIRALLAQTDALALVRGRWVEVDRQQLNETIERFRAVERTAAENGLGFRQAMRLMAGAQVSSSDVAAVPNQAWAEVIAGPWLAETLQGLRRPDSLRDDGPGTELRGSLRPYQQVGVRWLYLLAQLRLGACLADDMGLGKTIQVLALLLMLRRDARNEVDKTPSLLVAPASLLANWAAESERFAPALKTLIAHPSSLPAADLKASMPQMARQADLIITSYGSLLRVPWLAETAWRLVILDEAQVIKNPNAKQTRMVKSLNARARLALTGTPVENRLADLWSIFDFINPGLLGSQKDFSRFARQLADEPKAGYKPLRELVGPYILRRLKTDRSVISDLPDKTEIKAYCQLSRKQAALYEQAVRDLAAQLADVTGMQRRGLVLAFLMRFKQICNHPSQWLSDGAWHEEDSGKWARLREIAEVIAAKQEKVLIFTQVP